MRIATTALVGALVLAACGSEPSGKDGTPEVAEQSEAMPAGIAPDLAACPDREPGDEELRLRTEAISVPEALRGVVRSGMENFAVSTLSGGTVCVDASWMETVDNARLSADGRFASFDWHGYEAFGHVIVDRSGKGMAMDTGSAPLASPSGRLLAASDITESSYGPLNAFTVWQIDPEGIRQLAQHENVPAATDWKVERWAGETCVEMTAIPWEAYADPDPAENPPRERFRARRQSGWSVEPGRCPAA